MSENRGKARKKEMPKKKWMILAGVVIIALLAAFAVINMVKGDEAVDFKVLKEADIPQDIATQIIPEYRSLERALACMLDDKVYVIVSRGEKPTSGFEVSIDRMYLENNDGLSNLVVYANFKDPEPGTAVSQILTYPLQVAETSLAALPDQIELRVQYK